MCVCHSVTQGVEKINRSTAWVGPFTSAKWWADTVAFKGSQTTAWDCLAANVHFVIFACCYTSVFHFFCPWLIFCASVCVCFQEHFCVRFMNVYLSLRSCKMSRWQGNCHFFFFFLKTRVGDHRSKVSLVAQNRHGQQGQSREQAKSRRKGQTEKKREHVRRERSETIIINPPWSWKSIICLLFSLHSSSCPHLSLIFYGAATLILRKKTVSRASLLLKPSSWGAIKRC